MAIFGTKKKKEEKGAAASRSYARTQASHGGFANEILRAPWFSEKALIETEKGVYTFAVPQSATKASIAGAIKELYKVAPRMVRIVNLPAKKKALRTKRGVGTRTARRKAYVYLNKGDTIQFA
ncbi:TPA: 50S ribosomal protein L23 [Candidatus Kaiserbacteria bacterium]|nr:MAG: 50S ribosomal protein L23 [Parcubacteria group bacterium GW2011_GWA1_56_13]KKW45742.1 MAG: 50S ribosomal protein L23 [Parcubacteria group bacterium GW2011_GWB1_57_6]HCR52193.1 50S ribosomal protein L23 [Candidatus Kaiserbacteria bacterium]